MRKVVVEEVPEIRKEVEIGGVEGVKLGYMETGESEGWN